MACWICIATYNEKDNVKLLLEQILSNVSDGNVVVVDDNSPDGTGEALDDIAEQDDRVHPVHRSGKLGYASAHRAAMAYAMDHGADIVVTMDADFSHDPNSLPDLLRLIDDGADLAIGSRYVPGAGIENWGWHRRFLSSGANRLARIGLGMSVRDCTSGFRGYRTALLQRVRLDSFKSEGYCFLEELLLCCHLAGATIGETPIIFTERRAGKSKMTSDVIAEAVWTLARLSWARLFRRRRLMQTTLRADVLADGR